jgi:hypothetical protein
MNARTGSRIDYAAVYTGTTAPSPSDAAAESIADLARSLGTTSVVDLSAGDATLAHCLGKLGLDVLADVPTGGFSIPGLLLAGSDDATLELASDAVRQRFQEREFLTLCLDTLQRLDRADLPATLRALHRLSGKLLLVSIHSAPSLESNQYHSAVTPLSIWKEALEIAGFRVVDEKVFGGTCPLRRHVADGAELQLWEKLNLFREGSQGHEACLLLEKTGSVHSSEKQEALLRTLLRVRAPRPAAGDLLNVEWHFLLGHVQDFSMFQPFWEALPAERLQVWIRRGPDQVIDPARRRAMQSWLAAREIAHREVWQVEDTDWSVSSGDRRLLLTAAESSAAPSHILSAAFVTEAAFHGIPTFLLQHGIWVEDFSKPVAFASGQVLAWSQEHQACFEQTSMLGSGPRGVLDGTRFTVTGCPKFDEYARTDRFDLATALGSWVRAYRRIILCTTNLHWPQHKMSKADYYGALFQAAAADPETLFVIKLHPMEEPGDEILSSSPSNVVHLPEIAAWFADLRTSDLVRSADVVASTLSTVALEAALVGRPLIVLDTGNRYSYEGVPMHNLEELPQLLEHPEPAPVQFADHYYDMTRVGSSLDMCLEAISVALENSPAGTHPMRTTVLERALSQQLTAYAAEVESVREQPALAPAPAPAQERPPEDPGLNLMQGNLKVLEARLARALEENARLKSAPGKSPEEASVEEFPLPMSDRY